MTHWDIARCFIIGAFLAACAIVGWIAGGIVYFG